MKAGLLVILLAACGGPSAEAPVTVALGTPRDQVIHDLKAKQGYCAKDGELPQATEIYNRCARPGAEWGESWIAAKYDAGKLVELKRYERFSEDARAVERWNQLIGDRAKLNPPTDEAAAALKGRPLEPGTRSVKAFRVDGSTIVAVYLLTPTPPEDASILEAIVHVGN